MMVMAWLRCCYVSRQNQWSCAKMLPSAEWGVRRPTRQKCSTLQISLSSATNRLPTSEVPGLKRRIVGKQMTWPVYYQCTSQGSLAIPTTNQRR